VLFRQGTVSGSPINPEFLRKGRFDELFFVDLPTEQERAEIWGIQIAKYGRTPKSFNLAKLAQLSDGFTGSEIEAVFIEALYHCFDEQQREPKTDDLLPFIKECVPLSKMMADQIRALQEWAKGRTRRASLAAPTPIKSLAANGRKIAA
jgi:SpoVK/Ycf46/Vps4 family AAA+-type ATPase